MNSKHIDKEFENFAYNIKSLRVKNNLSLNSMAEKLKIDESTLTLLEKGELPEEVTVEILFLIRREFGVSPKDMFGKIIL